MKKQPDFMKNMSAIHRRDLLKRLSLLAASPLIPRAFSLGLAGLLGDEAMAQASEPKFFLEVNFRDQWDMGCAFVPPSIAKNYNNLGKDGDEGIAFFNAPTQVGNHFLTREGMALKDHVDTIAVTELGELVIGSIHGHEAGNGLRSPGRSYTAGAGRGDMSGADPRPNGNQGGNEVLFSSTPTPAVLYNHYTKSKDGDLKNGILLRSSIRANSHTFYHYNANLNNAQLDRFFDKKQLFNHFATAGGKPQGDVLTTYRAELVDLVKKLDTSFLKEIQLTQSKADGHLAALALAAKKNEGRLTKETLQLTADESKFWTSGIPGQFECAGDNADQCTEREGTMNIGEMFAYIAKMFQSGSFRSAAVDFDFHDVHTARTEAVLTNQGKQFGLSLSRLIQTLKDAGIYDKTVIALYTLDGSRSPKRNSTGDGSKNAVVLVGGGIKGGYYGDVSFKGRDVYYHRPDDNGNAVADGARDQNKRVPNADVYRTVTRAIGIPDDVVNQFPDAKNGKVLKYMLKA